MKDQSIDLELPGYCHTSYKALYAAEHPKRNNSKCPDGVYYLIKIIGKKGKVLFKFKKKTMYYSTALNFAKSVDKLMFEKRTTRIELNKKYNNINNP